MNEDYRILPRNNFTMAHPSMFQTPANDTERFSVMEQAKSLNPTAHWTIPTAKPQNALPRRDDGGFKYDPRDPPFTTAECSEIIRKLKPVREDTMTNARPTLLYYFFYSEENVKTLQKNIRYTVNKYSGFNVGEASLLELMLVMENVFTANANHIDEQRAPSSVLLRHIRSQLSILDDLVVNEAVPVIINAAEQHMSYLKRVENPISSQSLQRPMDTRVTGTKVYRSLTDVFALDDAM